MQLASGTARTVEALHVIVLILFSIFMPFCFKDAVTDASAWAAAVEESTDDVAPELKIKLLAAGSANADQAYGLVEDNESNVWTTLEVPNMKLPLAAEDVATPLPTGEKGSDGESGTGEGKCDGEDQGSLRMLPFLIALVGGGVFSLEAFEAFPML